jgi:DNA-binding MarR family transcriptional regulator
MLTLTTLWALTFKVIAPLLLAVAIVDALTQSRPRKIRSLYRSGNYSQRSLADRLGVTRHTVRVALGAA